MEPQVNSADGRAFVYRLATALQKYGTPSHRLEALVSAVAKSLGFEVELFATPTAVFVAFGEPPEQHVGLLGVAQGELDLGRLAELDEVAQETNGNFNAKLATAKIDAIVDGPARYPASVRLISHAVLCASSALALGGGARESAFSAVAGLFVGVLDHAATTRTALARLLLPLGALIAACVGVLGALLTPGLSAAMVGLAGIIYLVPGLTLTIAMNELTTGHLVSGTARLSRAFAAFMLLGVGASIGAALGDALQVTPANVVPIDRIWLVAALLLSTPAVLILLCVRPKDAAFASLTIVLCMLASELGLLFFDSLYAAGIATFVLGLCGNAWARFRNRPAAIAITPGLLLLVPGSIGFRAISAFLSDDVLTALTLSFHVALTAIALVSGLLIANLALSPRKAL